MSGNTLAEELGIGIQEEATQQDAESNNPEESNKDLSLDSEDKTSENNTESNTEVSRIEELEGQIAGMEKRITDKDSYINDQRAEIDSFKKVDEQPVKEESADYWDDPEAFATTQSEQIATQKQELADLRFQMAQDRYANTVDGYFDTVTQDKVNEAILRDSEFADKMNSSTEGYKVAYEYLTKQDQTKQSSFDAAVDKAVADKMKEAGIGQSKREAPPNINGSGSSSSSGTQSSTGAFDSVFG